MKLTAFTIYSKINNYGKEVFYTQNEDGKYLGISAFGGGFILVNDSNYTFAQIYFGKHDEVKTLLKNYLESLRPPKVLSTSSESEN